MRSFFPSRFFFVKSFWYEKHLHDSMEKWDGKIVISSDEKCYNTRWFNSVTKANDIGYEINLFSSRAYKLNAFSHVVNASAFNTFNNFPLQLKRIIIPSS